MEANLQNPLDIVADTLDHDVQVIPRLAIEDNHEPNEHPQGKADLTKSTDSKVKTADDRKGRDGRYSPDEDHLAFFAFWKVVVQTMNSTVELNGPDTETCADTR